MCALSLMRRESVYLQLFVWRQLGIKIDRGRNPDLTELGYLLALYSVSEISSINIILITEEHERTAYLRCHVRNPYFRCHGRNAIEGRFCKLLSFS